MSKAYAVFNPLNPATPRTFDTWDDVLTFAKCTLKGWKYKKFESRNDPRLLPWLRKQSSRPDLTLADVAHGLVNNTQATHETTSEAKSGGAEVDIYTDGGCKWNGTAKATAGLGIAIMQGDKIVITKALPHPATLFSPPTNNTAETYAVEAACDLILRESTSLFPDGVSSVRLWTDSKDVIKALEGGYPAVDSVPDDSAELVRARCLAWSAWRGLCRAFPGSTINKVKGHAGILGNELADKAATDGIAMWEKGRAKYMSCNMKE